MSITDIYDRDGNPLSWEQWAVLAEDDDYRRVDLTEVGPYVVSTVWLGLDHSYLGQGPPVIFETMVFTRSAWYDETDRDDPDHEPLWEMDARRYSTLSEAQEGHSETVLLVQATTVQEPPTGPLEVDSGHSGPSGPTDGPDVAYLVAWMP